MTGGPAHVHVAVDLGGASGRVIAATVDGGRVALRPVHRFVNRPVTRSGALRWNLARLDAEMRRGLHLAAEQAPGHAELTLGIDSWAIDYCRVDLDRGDAPVDASVDAPRHYRDPGITAGVDAVHARITPDELYRATGTQFLPFNTIYQLAVDGERPASSGERMLLIPDALVYRLTGAVGTEVTNASCTGMFDPRTRRWNDGVVARLGIDPSLLTELVEPGTVVGPTVETFGGHRYTVVRVASHDTASAVVAAPGEGDDWAYISSGTWSLVGVELDRPVISDAGRAANLTNEVGADGTVRCLRNVAGMWLLQESVRAWRTEGRRWKLTELLAAATALGPGPTFDPDDPDLIAPGDMPARIRARCDGLGDDVAVTRAIMDSLAAKYAEVLDRLEPITGRTIDVVHIVGGGARNSLLCQLTADVSGRTVVAGPVEATAIGNALVQARAYGALGGTLDALRSIVRASTALHTYRPGGATR